MGCERPQRVDTMFLGATMLRHLIWAPSALARADLATYRAAVDRISEDSFDLTRYALWKLMETNEIQGTNLPCGPLRNMAAILVQTHGNALQVFNLRTTTKSDRAVHTASFKAVLRHRSLDRQCPKMHETSSHAAKYARYFNEHPGGRRAGLCDLLGVSHAQWFGPKCIPRTVRTGLPGADSRLLLRRLTGYYPRACSASDKTKEHVLECMTQAESLHNALTIPWQTTEAGRETWINSVTSTDPWLANEPTIREKLSEVDRRSTWSLRRLIRHFLARNPELDTTCPQIAAVQDFLEEPPAARRKALSLGIPLPLAISSQLPGVEASIGSWSSGST